jgi:fructuronate reductase
VRLVHLGLGNFFRAHQCWYTEHTADAAGWGFAAFTGRSASPVVDDLTAQDGLYALVSRAADTDRFEVTGSLSRVHAAIEEDAWLRYFSSPEVVAATITVTEAGYLRGAGGGLDTARPEVRADLEALRHGSATPVRTAPGRLVAGLAARRRADAGPFTLVPCDNTPGNGALVERVVGDLAEMVDVALAAGTALGAAILGLIGLGGASTLADAASRFTDPGAAPPAAVTADPALATVYDRLYSSVPALIGSLDSVAALFARKVRRE